MFSNRHFIKGSVMIKHFNFFNLRGPNSFTTGNPSYNPSTNIRRGQNSGRITVSQNGRGGPITISQNGRVLSQDEINDLPEYIKMDIRNKYRNSFNNGNPSHNPSTNIRRGQNSGRITVSQNGRGGPITISQNGRVLSQDEINDLPEHIKMDIRNKYRNSGNVHQTNTLSSGTNNAET